MLFDFINFYGTLFYIALVKKWVQEGEIASFSGIELKEQCIYGNCLLELTIQMVIQYYLKTRELYSWASLF